MSMTREEFELWLTDCVDEAVDRMDPGHRTLAAWSRTFTQSLRAVMHEEGLEDDEMEND